MINLIKQDMKAAHQLLADFSKNEANLAIIKQISENLAACYANGNKVLICGNGGSATDSMHFAEEFTGRFRKDRRALPAISLTDSSHLTCTANDYGFEYVFSRGVDAFGKAGDMVIGLSTSGNSENVIEALRTGKEKDLITVALLGKDGGKLKGFCDFELIIPGKTSDRIQEIHMLVLHIIIEMVERKLFPENY